MPDSPRPAGGTEEAFKAEVLAAAMRLERDDEALLVRCAWCGRYSLGSTWLDERELSRWAVMAKVHSEQITHSICSDCSDSH